MSEEELKKNQDRIRIIGAIDLGQTVAELDTRLFETRIETSVFTALLNDRVDLIPGTKGSGKTALFRLITELKKDFLLKLQVILITGVEASGDPVFQAFKDKFESLSEIEFENFWRIYFVALVNERFIKSEEWRESLQNAAEEVRNLREKIQLARIPEYNKPASFLEIVSAILRRISVKFGNTSVGEKGASHSAMSVELGSQHVSNSNEGGPVFLNDIHEALIAVLNKTNVKVWIMLDRLDEVFLRRTKLEQIALRSLLRATRNFPTQIVRI